MAYTGVLEKDATQEEIRTAQKTVQIITEVNGKKYVSEYDGTDGYMVMALKGERFEVNTKCDGNTMLNFARSLLDEIPEKLVMMIIADRIGLLDNKKSPLSVVPGGKQHAE